MIDLPKLTGREFKPFDWIGWLIFLISSVSLCILINDVTLTWPIKIMLFGTNIIFFFEYGSRILNGRVYKHVYFDTIVHKMYEITLGADSEDKYFICAENEQDLRQYIEIHYPFVGHMYKIIGEHNVESYIKRELFQ